ncbi:MAG: aminotransferase class V-fold PLP-dependent enzyme, partial [Geminicoccaceae bacterium]
HLIEHGFFDMDPCNLHDGEAEVVATRLFEILEDARAGKIPRRQLAEIRTGRVKSLVDWLS